VEEKYKRIEDLDDKIKNISLPYLEWKVLFLVTEETTIKDIAKYISEEEKVLTQTVESLLGKGLIEISTAEEKVSEEAEEKETTETEEVEEIDLKEEEYEEAPIEDETKIEVSEVSDESDATEEEILDMKEEEEPVDDVTEMPDLVEEESEPADTEMQMESEIETEVQEEEKESPVSGGDIMSDFMTDTQEEVVETKETEAQEPEKPESTAGHKSIMVIDDSIVIRKMIEIALEDEDFRILNATSGKEGMEAMEKEKPDLVILDMLLPDMNGIDVLKKIKDTIDVPVIMLSGKDSPQLVENAKEVGVNDFLPKPFKDEELVEKVKALVN
jgi:CheY-like chemotaxis protein